MTADLSEERSTSNITTERLEAETAERLRLEKELTQKEEKVRSLQDISEKLEMELICAKSDMNGYVWQCNFQSAISVCDFTARILWHFEAGKITQILLSLDTNYCIPIGRLAELCHLT